MQAFEFNDPNWGKLLVITSEFAPRDEVLEWAKKLASSDRYKEQPGDIYDTRLYGSWYCSGKREST